MPNLWVIEEGVGTKWTPLEQSGFTKLSQARRRLALMRKVQPNCCFRITRYVACVPSIHKGKESNVNSTNKG